MALWAIYGAFKEKGGNMNRAYIPGSGRRMGSVHAHVDTKHHAGCGCFSQQFDFPTKAMFVDSLALTQQALADYIHHPPNRPGDCILTTILDPWEEGRAAEWLNVSLDHNGPTEVEVEQVVATVSGSGRLVWLPQEKRIGKLNKGPVYSRATLVPHLDTEFHLRIDVPKTATFPDPVTLLSETLGEGMGMRSWYRFDRGESWGYNSNQFSDYAGAEDEVLRNHRLMAGYLRRCGFAYPLYTFLEAVLIICHSEGLHAA